MTTKPSTRPLVVASESIPTPLPIGVLVWQGLQSQLAIIAKMTLTWSGSSLDSRELLTRLAPTQEPLCKAQPSRHPGSAPSELYYPSDFVPRKHDADVLLVGHARTPTPTQRISGQISVAGVARRFVVAAGTPAPAIPLTSAYLQSDDGSVREPLGPITSPGSPDPDVIHGEDFDFSCYNAASTMQRAQAIPANAAIDLAGVFPDGQQRTVRLPGLKPLVTLDGMLHQDTSVDLVCDTLWIDLDRELIVLVWRGSIEMLEDNPGIDRMVVSLERSSQEVDLETRRSSLIRGHLGFAVRKEDPPGAFGPRNEDEEDRLAFARYGTWDANAPPPRITLPEYATISAELTEWPDQRQQTLSRHDLDEDRWAIEERGWLEAMANRAMDGDARLADRYGGLFIEAQDALATPAERAQTLERYAPIYAAMDAEMDPEVVLKQYKLTLAQWLRMERRWRQAAQQDPKVAEELDRLVEAAEPRTQPKITEAT